ncbi:MAG: hypothetical protein EXX96DRAFT_587034 [Benjaminiella poitrasii]|nr:MAG: hypothetical protein EXX96DRAFT_587034 [Benjaminiella poitrasii]
MASNHSIQNDSYYNSSNSSQHYDHCSSCSKPSTITEEEDNDDCCSCTDEESCSEIHSHLSVQQQEQQHWSNTNSMSCTSISRDRHPPRLSSCTTSSSYLPSCSQLHHHQHHGSSVCHSHSHCRPLSSSNNSSSNHKSNPHRSIHLTEKSIQSISSSSSSSSCPSSPSTVTKQRRDRRHREGWRYYALCHCCCGRNSLFSRMFVFCLFSFLMVGGVAAFFCWPRTPRVSMGGGADSLNGRPDWWNGQRTPLPPADAPIPSRPSLQATWQVNVTLDNRDNWIPIHVNQLDFVMVDSLTLAKFAWASTTSGLDLMPGVISPLSLTFNVNYQAADRTDPTFQNLYNACGPQVDGKTQRPALNVLLQVYFHIFGVMWTPVVTATPYTGGILCPV